MLHVKICMYTVPVIPWLNKKSFLSYMYVYARNATVIVDFLSSIIRRATSVGRFNISECFRHRSRNGSYYTICFVYECGKLDRQIWVVHSLFE